MSFIRKLFGLKPKPLHPLRDIDKCTDAIYDAKAKIMTIHMPDGYTYQYKGTATTWSKMPYMHHVGVDGSMVLLRIWEYYEHYGNPYPTAHKTEKPDSSYL